MDFASTIAGSFAKKAFTDCNPCLEAAVNQMLRVSLIVFPHCQKPNEDSNESVIVVLLLQ